MIARRRTSERLERDGDVILYNPLTNRKIFTTAKNEAGIPPEDIEELEGDAIEIVKPGRRKVRAEVTLVCNGGCSYCLVYKNDISQLHTAMTMETAGDVVRFFNNNARGGSLMIIGGEPLTNWEVTRYLIEGAEGTSNLFTNATLVDDDIARFLAEKKVKVFASNDGFRGNNLRRRLSGGSEMYGSMIDGYRRLKDAGCNAGITCVATDGNVRQLDEIARHFREDLDCRFVGISVPHFTRDGEAKVDIREYTEQMKRIFAYAKDRGLYVDQLAKRLAPLIEEKLRAYACKIVGEQVTFYPDGTKTLCTKLDTLPEFKEITEDYLFKKLPINSSYCNDCDAIGICGGGCPWDAYHDENGFDSRDCYFNQEILKTFLWDMHKAAKEGRKDFRREYSGILEIK
jgi:uncharacterized protein